MPDINGINLKSLVPSESVLNKRLIWVNFKGVKFQVRYISRITLSTIAEQCVVAGYDSTKKARSRQLDPQKFAKAMATTIVHDWQGATLRALANIMPINLEGMTPAQLDADVPFNEENLCMVVENAHELDGFLQECAVDASLFRADNAEDVTKNSVSSLSGN